MPNSSRFVRFPSVAIGSHEEFEAYRQSNRSQLDARYLHEVGLASEEAVVERPGSCAVCLRATTYTSSTADGDKLPDGRVMPNWREEQSCDCQDRLTQRGRALLHFALATQGLQSWTRMLLFGRPTAFDDRFGSHVRSVTKVSRMYLAGPTDDGDHSYRIPADDGAFHAIVSSDSLQHVPPLAAVLTEMHRVLTPGGRLIFTIPFHFSRRETVSRMPITGQPLPADVNDDVHAIGWDIIDRLYDVGFDDAQAHTYWSDELGYLGSFKTIFMAMR